MGCSASSAPPPSERKEHAPKQKGGHVHDDKQLLAQQLLKMEAKRVGVGKSSLLLHFDVNKTIIMSDKAANKSTDHLLNIVLANSSWGRITGKAGERKWELQTEEVSVRRPEKSLVSYAEFVEKLLPFCDKKSKRTIKKARDDLLIKFTEKENPGKNLQKYVRILRKNLLLPKELVGSKAALDSGLVGSEVFLLPSFLKAVRSLYESGRNFSIVFRTFGHDLEDVAKEYNAFCEGRHPLHMNFKMDGTDGKPDMRLDFSTSSTYPGCIEFFMVYLLCVLCDLCFSVVKPNTFSVGRFGSIDRTRKGVDLCMGTLRQRSSVDEGNPFHDFLEEKSSQHQNEKRAMLISSKERIYRHILDLTKKPRTLAIRDCFIHWRENKQIGSAGKVFVLDSLTAKERHQIFFDDNIRYDDARIVDVCDIRSPNVTVPLARVIDRFIVRAEPLESILNENYFIEKIMECEQNLQRAQSIRERFREALQKTKLLSSILASPEENMKRRPSTEYLSWQKLPKLKLVRSASTFDETECHTESLNAETNQ